jgi:hypothetical protein
MLVSARAPADHEGYLGKVAADTAYQNAKKNSDKQNARIEHDKALARVVVRLMRDDTELFKQFSDNAGFKRRLADTVFGMTYVHSHPTHEQSCLGILFAEPRSAFSLPDTTRGYAARTASSKEAVPRSSTDPLAMD